MALRLSWRQVGTLSYTSILKTYGQRQFPKRLLSTSTGSETLLQETDGVIKIFRLNEPKRKNPFTKELARKLAGAIREADSDPSINLIAITGVGDSFSSGMDLKAFRDAPSKRDYAIDGTDSFRQLFAASIDCKKPLFGLVNGPTVGAGMTILGLCDAVYAASTATFTCPFTSLSLCPEGASSYAFPRLMGYSRAGRLLLCNERIDVQKAYEWNFVSEIIPKEDFEKISMAKLRAYSELPIKSLLYSKELIRGRQRAKLHAANEKECEGVEKFLQSEELLRAVNKFFERKR